MKTQNEIYQEVFDRALSVISGKWSEIYLMVRIDEESSELIKYYLVTESGTTKEQSLPYIPNYLDLFLELRDHLSVGGKQKFTHCVVKFTLAGEFKADYSYDSVDWEIIDGTWSIEASQKS